MYHPMIFIHWRQARLALLPFVVAAFSLPLLSVQGLGGVGDPQLAYQALSRAEVWLVFYPMLAVTVGAVLGLTAWTWDHQFRHVHALSLPIARWRYVLLKMGAGLVITLAPTAALWVGARLAAASVTLPVGLNTYPDQLALRFFLAVLASYGAIFAAGAGTVKTTLWVFSSLTGLLFLAGISGDAVATLFPTMGFENGGLVDAAMRLLVDHPGPLSILTGNWSLIDV